MWGRLVDRKWENQEMKKSQTGKEKEDMRVEKIRFGKKERETLSLFKISFLHVINAFITYVLIVLEGRKN